MEDTTFRTSHPPNLTHTLLLIETNRYIPLHSHTSLQHQDPQPQDDEPSLSLEGEPRRGKREKPSSASLIKSRRTGCTCKKTKCLKMYCECFSQGNMCSP